jgi:cytochrome c oxidase subunit II
MITSLLPQDPQPPQRWQLPVQASTFAEDHDNLYTFVEWVNYIFFFGIVFVLFYAVIKYRRKTPDQPPASTITHHTAIEVTWTVIPLIIVMVIFAWGWVGYADMALAPADSLQYEVKAKRWSWSFKHPGTTNFVVQELWVPVDTPAQMTMSSADVLHSFFIPAFRVKRDVLPGRYQTVWFRATHVGDYNIFCTEFCGDGHSKMIGMIHVVSKETWAGYQKIGAAVPWDPFLPTDDPGDPDYEEGRMFNGEIVYKQNCSTCHTLNGNPSTGPSFKGLWTRNIKRLGLEGKTPEEQETAMAAYILESVRDPNKVIATDFKPPSAMTPYSEEALNDERVNDMVGFLKSEKYK